MEQVTSAHGLSALIDDDHSTPTKDVFRIGDLAKEFDVTLRTLRFYEDRGLISPRRSGATRLYSIDDRQRLKLILLAKRFGFTLIDIQEILHAHDENDASQNNFVQIVNKFKGQVSVLEKQSQELEKAKEELKDAIEYLEDLI